MHWPRRLALVLVVCVTLLGVMACGVLSGPRTSRTTERLTPTPISPQVIPSPTALAPEVTASPTPWRSDEEQLLIQLYKQVIPSVVSIQVVRKAASVPGSATPGDVYQRGQGSGFIADGPEGIVVSNNHVVEGAELVEVVLWDGTILPAEILGRDPDSDLAVLKVERGDRAMRAVALGDSDALQVGQRAIAIGNPFGWQGTLTVGIISGLGRTLRLGHVSERVSGRFSIPEMIQTDAAINLGNSGGPLLDTDGRVIGVNTAINSLTGASGGVGFAVPINTVRRVLPDLVEKGSYAYPWIGITGTDLRPVHVEAMDLSTDRGAIVVAVTEEGPASEAGLKGSASTIERFGEEIGIGGDVITAIDGQPVHQFDDLLVYLIREKRPGDEVRLSILRDDQRMHLDVVLGQRPTD